MGVHQQTRIDSAKSLAADWLKEVQALETIMKNWSDDQLREASGEWEALSAPSKWWQELKGGILNVVTIEDRSRIAKGILEERGLHT